MRRRKMATPVRDVRVSEKPGARRQRIHRARKRDGVQVLGVEVSREVRQALLIRGWAADDADMADAISDLLDCWADGRLTDSPISNES